MRHDLWARFDLPEKCQRGTLVDYPDKHHLVLTPLDVNGEKWNYDLACQDSFNAGTHLRLCEILVEASRTVECRKKCPACYFFWLSARDRSRAVGAALQDKIDTAMGKA